MSHIITGSRGLSKFHDSETAEFIGHACIRLCFAVLREIMSSRYSFSSVACSLPCCICRTLLYRGKAQTFDASRYWPIEVPLQSICVVSIGQGDAKKRLRVKSSDSCDDCYHRLCSYVTIRFILFSFGCFS